jgi:hypothetical protein
MNAGSSPPTEGKRLYTRVVGRTFRWALLAFLIPTGLVALGPLCVYLTGGGPTTIDQIGPPLASILVYLQLWSISIPPLIVLFGLYQARDDMRDAVAGATMTAFIVILSEAILLNLGDQTGAFESLRATMLTSFTALVGSITLFYFGSEAVIHYSDARAADAKAATAKVEAEHASKEAEAAATTSLPE